MKESVIYIRQSSIVDFKDEYVAAQKYFKVVNYFTDLPRDSLVIPRYSALPFNKDFCQEVLNLGSTTINSYREHSYVADIKNWYEDLKEFTPETWFKLEDVPNMGSFVLKGNTNSKKHLWNTHMFASNREDVNTVYSELHKDSLVGYQDIYVRRYVPLLELDKGLNDLPISEEYRFFILRGEVIASGFYWSSFLSELPKGVTPDAVPQDFLQNVIDRVGDSITFWVVDIARTAEGRWIVIELNDGQQSGLSSIDPDLFYKRLKNAVSKST